MDEKKYIPGIYNYCDRWCERCAFTDRCRVFASDPANIEGLPDNPDSPEFWDQLRNHFQDALDLLQNIADKLDSPEPGTGNPKEKPTPERRGLNDPYADTVDRFFSENTDFFEQQEEAYEDKVKMGLPIDVEQLGFLHEALSTIRWFQHFILAKMNRAVSDFELEPESADDLQGDGNGSAKVAMIAIQRSIDAWTYVQKIFPDKKEEINQLHKVLMDMKSNLEKAFPHWQQFHRPGFDDEPETVVRLDFNPN